MITINNRKKEEMIMDGLNNKTNNIGMKKKEEKEEKTMKGLKDKTNNIEMKKKLYEMH